MGMAKSTVRLLIADTAAMPRAAATGRHHHAFWQLEHCAVGTITARLPVRTVVLTPGHGILLPPGTPHDLHYRAGTRYVAWKFSWDQARPHTIVHLDQQPGWRGLAAALAVMATQPATPAVAHLLTAVLLLSDIPPAPPAGTDLIADLTRLLEVQPPHAWSVASLARALGFTPGHVSARLRVICGMSAKRWLDVQRAERTGRSLIGSDLGLTEIAERGGFSDQFALSRFFRRVTGETPTAFRSRQLG